MDKAFTTSVTGIPSRRGKGVAPWSSRQRKVARSLKRLRAREGKPCGNQSQRSTAEEQHLQSALVEAKGATDTQTEQPTQTPKSEHTDPSDAIRQNGTIDSSPEDAHDAQQLHTVTGDAGYFDQEHRESLDSSETHDIHIAKQVSLHTKLSDKLWKQALRKTGSTHERTECHTRDADVALLGAQETTTGIDEQKGLKGLHGDRPCHRQTEEQAPTTSKIQVGSSPRQAPAMIPPPHLRNNIVRLRNRPISQEADLKLERETQYVMQTFYRDGHKDEELVDWIRMTDHELSMPMTRPMAVVIHIVTAWSTLAMTLYRRGEEKENWQRQQDWNLIWSGCPDIHCKRVCVRCPRLKLWVFMHQRA